MVKQVFYENSYNAEFMYYPNDMAVLSLDERAEDFLSDYFLSSRTKFKQQIHLTMEFRGKDGVRFFEEDGLVTKVIFPSKRKAKHFLYDVCRVRLDN